jgi:hypothetical protein
MTRGIAIAACVVLAGCAGVTEPVPVGDGVYMVANHGVMGWSSGPAQKAAALQKAAMYCNGMGKELQTISATDSGPGGFGKISSAEVQFRCIGSSGAGPR